MSPEAESLRRLLTVITGHSELILRDLAQADPLRRNVENIKRAAESGMVLTRRLLDQGWGEGPASAAAVATAPAAAPPMGGGETVLLVEDEPEVREMIREILQLHGYVVLEARDGAQALAVSGRHPGAIHLVLADVVSRGAGGAETLRRLTAARPEARALYMSGYLPDVVAERGTRHHGRFLQKPFTVDALVQKVREVLDEP